MIRDDQIRKLIRMCRNFIKTLPDRDKPWRTAPEVRDIQFALLATNGNVKSAFELLKEQIMHPGYRPRSDMERVLEILTSFQWQLIDLNERIKNLEHYLMERDGFEDSEEEAV